MNFTREQEQEAAEALASAAAKLAEPKKPVTAHVRRVKHQKSIRELEKDWWQTYGLMLRSAT